MIVGRAFVALQRSLEVAHERTLLGTASKIGFVEPAHRARNDISLQKVEARTAVRTGAHRDEVHDLFDFIGADLPVLADHLRVFCEWADRRLQIDRDVRAAHDLRKRLPAIAVVDEDRVDSGG